MRISYEAYMASPEWEALRQRAFEKYGRRCQCCGQTWNLTVHHLRYRSLINARTRDLMILCWPCHKEFHEAKKMKECPRIKNTIANTVKLINWKRSTVVRLAGLHLFGLHE